ncbi:succinate dehydrogenase cytochrome b subunit [Flavobacteriaceae bacterium]|jgi:succinate dehydrogenase / fumarate reductase cytochrome b subunit|nr:succinate dehydrogenase cytochrome b subunit [Flavobacteriaceae bacterium]MDA9203823.1 succinate dehydrogenase cytochrome b subunit [Flavobacteriaceae bacterium]MDC1010136.1 succinate dehydrogenase cytochrome b subunit [Flavobacteriaceae bacterium]
MKLMSSSIGRKILMALSGIFLVVFLTQHFLINITSVFSENLFNTLSHFMGNNPLVQFILQPVLIFGVIFHFVMGFYLEILNSKSRKKNYSKYSGSSNASWISRNMIFSGGVILIFLVLHFIDFWIPEMNYKYVEVLPEDPNRYFEELVHKFESPIRTLIYSLSFIFLALHLLHGFSSSFKTVGVNSKYYDLIQKATFIFSITIPLGFIFIAIFHNLTS